MSVQFDEEVHVNRRFLVDEARRITGDAGGRVLDFGCGAGQLVVAGRSAGLDVYGADPYTGRLEAKEAAEAAGILGDVIRPMVDGRLPFPDGYFSVVVSNQVFEHVDDIDTALSEIARVLEPGGTLVALFLSRAVVREGHVGVPLAHWFPRGSRAMYAWVLLLRTLGFGLKKPGKTRRQWTRDVCDYLDEYTVYRPKRVIVRAFSRHFRFGAAEPDYIRFRLGASRRLRSLLGLLRLPGAPLAGSLLLRALAGLVIRATKPADDTPASRLRDRPPVP